MIFSKSSCLSILFLELEVQRETFFLSYINLSLCCYPLPSRTPPASHISYQMDFSSWFFRFKDLIIYMPIITGYIKAVLNADRMSYE